MLLRVAVVLKTILKQHLLEDTLKLIEKRRQWSECSNQYSLTLSDISNVIKCSTSTKINAKDD